MGAFEWIAEKGWKYVIGAFAILVAITLLNTCAVTWQGFAAGRHQANDALIQEGKR